MARESGSLAQVPAASPQAPATGPARLEAPPAPPAVISAAIPAVPTLLPAAGRRPYQPPRILFREPLEAMAAICSPHPPAKNNKGVCPMGPISS